jgi:hypothetical protein
MQIPKCFAWPVLALLTFIESPLFAAFPAGSDQFENAPDIDFITGVSDPTDLTVFTVEQNEPAHHPAGHATTHSAWWKWTPVVPGYCTIDTVVSNLVPDHATNTAVAVYFGSSLTSLTAVGRNDDAFESGLSQATFFALPGTTYYIAVDCPEEGAGTVVLRLRQLILQDAEWIGALKPLPTSNSYPGFLSIKTTRNGLLTGQLWIGARKFSFKGAWGLDGRFRAVFPQLTKTAQLQALPVELLIDGAENSLGLAAYVNVNNDMISGTLGRVTRFTPQSPSPERGSYTLTIVDNGDMGAGGIRYSVSPAGRVKGAGYLGDGQAIAFGSVLTEPFANEIRQFAVHLPLFGGNGYLNGYVYCAPVETGTFEMRYLRPPNAASPFYPSGFLMEVEGYGSLYTPPQRGQRVFGLLNPSGNGSLIVLQAGDEISAFTESLTLGTDNKFRFANPQIRHPSLRIDPATGWITGSLTEPAGKRRKLRGIVARVGSTTHAFGQVSGATRTGSFGITP